MAKDWILEKLLTCNGDPKCVLQTLSHLGVSNVDFTLEEIGKILHITRERVRQIETAALKKLKHPKIARKLLEYLRS